MFAFFFFKIGTCAYISNLSKRKYLSVQSPFYCPPSTCIQNRWFPPAHSALINAPLCIPLRLPAPTPRILRRTNATPKSPSGAAPRSSLPSPSPPGSPPPPPPPLPQSPVRDPFSMVQSPSVCMSTPVSRIYIRNHNTHAYFHIS